MIRRYLIASVAADEQAVTCPEDVLDDFQCHTIGPLQIVEKYHDRMGFARHCSNEMLKDEAYALEIHSCAVLPWNLLPKFRGGRHEDIYFRKQSPQQR
mmetsp:Transcript_17168/g.26137  ORF Transcript_17168/g.26137 Transcript_17168/m.26137 type:complete len:98 (+) Transcript_17168:767-1060(+)